VAHAYLAGAGVLFFFPSAAPRPGAGWPCSHPASSLTVATVTLIMLLLLSVAMLALTPFWLGEGLAFDAPFGVVFSVLFFVEAILLGRGAARLHATRRPWLRPSLWRMRARGSSARLGAAPGPAPVAYRHVLDLPLSVA